MQTEFVAESALKRFVDAFATTSGLGRISGNRADTEFREGAADLSQMAFENLAAGLGGEKEMAGPVGIQGAEDAVGSDTVFEQAHAT